MSDIGERKGRTLILCFDGTADQFDEDNTNVVKFFGLLKKDNFEEQLCYYQPGIGTWFDPGVVSPIFHWGAKVLDKAFAWYINNHVIEGYKFLMQNYCMGDRICIFGFSRGAYTARALAGLLHKVGLLPKDNEQQVAFAYKFYKRNDQRNNTLCEIFKETFCQTVEIEFLGVWDTVACVGMFSWRHLPFTNSNKIAKTFRHALSLDEHRAKFRPSYYLSPPPDDGAVQRSPTPEDKSPSPKSTILDHKTEEDGRDTDHMEVWFAGCHADVGGGAVEDDKIHRLAKISLQWMVQEVMRAHCIKFDKSALARAGIPDVCLSIETLPAISAFDENGKPEQPHDRMKESPIWWLLEIVPTCYSRQNGNGVCREFGFHFGRGRKILHSRPIFHSSVEKMINSRLYTPKAKWKVGSEIYVS